MVSVMPEKNKVPKGVETKWEIDSLGNFVDSDSNFSSMKHIRQQVVDGSIIPLIHFTEPPISTKSITANLASLKLDFHIFGATAEGFIYIDDMLTFEKGNLFLKVANYSGKWKVNVISNTFETLKYDEGLSLDKQSFVN